MPSDRDEGASGRVVTISASYGSGGSVIAPLIAQLLDLPFADRLVPAQGLAVAARETMSDEEQDESAVASFWARLAHVTGGLAMPVPKAEHLGLEMRDRVEQSIHELARTGAVILGRAASIVLSDNPWAYHVRLDGPEERRVRRAAEIEGIGLDLARQRLEETDRARTRFMSRLYGRDPTEPGLYHLVVDATVLTVDDCARLVAAGARAYWGCAPRSGDG